MIGAQMHGAAFHRLERLSKPALFGERAPDLAD